MTNVKILKRNVSMSHLRFRKPVFCEQDPSSVNKFHSQAAINEKVLNGECYSRQGSKTRIKLTKKRLKRKR